MIGKGWPMIPKERKNVISLDNFKGRNKLKEIYKGFIRCPDCLGLYHLQSLNSGYCLPKKILNDAITFNTYMWNGQRYFLDERAMIDFARYHGEVE